MINIPRLITFQCEFSVENERHISAEMIVDGIARNTGVSERDITLLNYEDSPIDTNPSDR